MVQDCRYKSSCPSASCGLKNSPLMDFSVKNGFHLLSSSQMPRRVSLRFQEKQQQMQLQQHLISALWFSFLLSFWFASLKKDVRALTKEAFLMRWIGFRLSRSEKGRSEHDTEMGFLHIFCHVLNLVSLSSVHCVSWKILDYTHQSFRTDSLHCCILLQITAQDFAVDSRPIVAAWSVYQKGRNLGTVFQDQPSSQVWALF